MTDARTEWDAIAAQIPDINSLPESDGVTMFENILSEWALKHGPALLTTITDLRAEVSRLTGEINAHKDAIAEAQGIIAELKEEALRALPTVDGWQGIDSAPKVPLHGTAPEILVYGESGMHVAWSCWGDEAGLPVWFNGDVAVSATHWMPLPAPPS